MRYASLILPPFRRPKGGQYLKKMVLCNSIFEEFQMMKPSLILEEM